MMMGKQAVKHQCGHTEQVQVQGAYHLAGYCAGCALRAAESEARVINMLEGLGIHEAPAEGDDPFGGDV